MDGSVLVDNIIDLSKRKKEKEKDTAFATAIAQHDSVLDYCDELFPEGVVLVAMVNGELEISSSIQDHETMYAALFAAAITVRDKLDKE